MARKPKPPSEPSQALTLCRPHSEPRPWAWAPVLFSKGRTKWKRGPWLISFTLKPKNTVTHNSREPCCLTCHPGMTPPYALDPVDPRHANQLPHLWVPGGTVAGVQSPHSLGDKLGNAVKCLGQSTRPHTIMVKGSPTSTCGAWTLSPRRTFGPEIN